MAGSFTLCIEVSAYNNFPGLLQNTGARLRVINLYLAGEILLRSMKKIILLTGLLITATANCMMAQCTSPAGSYDLVVTGSTALSPSGPQFMYGYVCAGGHLLDSTNCCTRWIHVDSGGVYEAGPNAYGILYLKSGATFEAHGNTNFFNVYYETGAVILNYTGPQTLCNPVTFPSANCAIGIDENQTATVHIYPNPNSGRFTISSSLVNGHLRVYNTLGQIAHQQILTSANQQINLSNPGIYFLEITSGEKRLVSRIIVD